MDISINDLFSLREWAPLNDLLNKIPSKWYSGIFISDISLTCIDVLPDFIAIGTNAGIAFWYDRKKGDLQRLRCEGQSQIITTIRIISSVDYMVACGTDSGLISVFTIPKQLPTNLPERETKIKSAERYCIRDLHSSSITSLEWSKNGMKLFSGDHNGCVVLTEIDFYMHLCKSSELLNESYEIVQMSYNHPKLLVSTLFRTIITEKKDSKWEVWQVGRQDRKSLSALGSIFAPLGYPREPHKIYSCRPGHRLWIADGEGNVEQTIFFKDTLHKPKIVIPVLNPSNVRTKISSSDLPGFGIVYPYGSFLMTHSNNIMYILDPVKPQVIAILTQFRNILSASICGHEIFILEGPRSLIRISTMPDNNVIRTETNLATLITNPIISTLHSIKNFNNDNEPIETSVDNESITNAEECFELPPVEKLPTNLITLKVHDTNHDRKAELFDKISEQQFDENILFKSQVKKRRSSPKSDKLVNDIEKLCDCISEVGYKTTIPCEMTLSFCDKEDIIMPDLRSPQSIEKDIQHKERQLAKVLNLEEINISDQKSTNDEYTNLSLLPNIQPSTEGAEEKPEKDKFESTKSDVQVDNKTPKILDIPCVWNLQKVEITERHILPDLLEKTSLNDIDSDWEVL